MDLYNASGKVLDISGGGGGSGGDSITVDGAVIGINNDFKLLSSPAHYYPSGRTNIVQTTAYTTYGTTRWHSVGLKIRNVKGKSSVTLDYKVNITGGASKFYSVVGSSYKEHDYTSGEQSYTDTFENLGDEDYVNFHIRVATPANTDNQAFQATGRTLKIEALPNGFELVGAYVNESPVMTVSSLTFDESNLLKIDNQFAGRFYASFGDSITQQSFGYAPVAANVLDVGYYANFGVGGTSAVQLAAVFNSKAYQGADLITIGHGVNDFDNTPNSPIGTIEDDPEDIDTSTYIGAFQYMINSILLNSPNSKIVLITPIYNTRENTPNTLGLNLVHYRRACISVANHYGLHYIEGDKIITFANASQYLEDGTHPNEAGGRYYGQKVADILANMIFE